MPNELHYNDGISVTLILAAANPSANASYAPTTADLDAVLVGLLLPA